MLKVCYKFVTKSKPFDFKIIRPDGFVVKEIIDSRKLDKYSFHGSKGKCNIYAMKKINMNTMEAIKILEEKFGEKFGYAGLKDKNAVTYQYISSRKMIEKFHYENGQKILDVKFFSRGKCLSPGDLVGNMFEIRADRKINAELPSRLPNYFGEQRFGTERMNHIFGYHILRREFDKVPNIKNKKMVKFFINAYQSWIFNEVINELIGEIDKIKEIPLPGYSSRPKKNDVWKTINRIHKDHGITLNDYRINELSITVIGGTRPSSMIIKNLKINDNVLSFELPKGSYATVVINEIRKVRCL